MKESPQRIAFGQRQTGASIITATVWLAAIAGLTHAAPIAGGIPSDPEADRPNFILFFTDDQGADMYGFLNGDPSKDFRQPDEDYLTPAYDRLAEEGVYFSNAYVNSTICAPSRYSIYSGSLASRYVLAHNKTAKFSRDGLNYNGNYNDPAREALYQSIDVQNQWHPDFGSKFNSAYPSLFKILHEGGYFTGFTGKVDGFSTPHSNYAELREAVKAHGIDFAEGLVNGNSYAPYGYHNQEYIGWAAMNFLDEVMAQESASGSNQPFFIAVNPTIPHSPKQVSSLTVDAATRRGTPMGVVTEAEYQAMLDAQGYGFEEPYSREFVIDRANAFTGLSSPDFRAPILWVDDTLTSLLKKLEDMGELENTYVIHLSDHGYGGSGAKGDIYQIGANVPLLIRGPGVEAGTELTAAVSAVDITATIYEAAGLLPPTEVPFDGVSFLDILHGRSDGADRSVLVEIGYTKAVVQGNWKYTAFRIPDGFLAQAAAEGVDPYSNDLDDHDANWGTSENPPIGDNRPFMTHFARFGPWSTHFGNGWIDYPHYFSPDQLYDIVADPAEQNNLADPANPDFAPEKLLEMKILMARHLAGAPGSFGELKHGMTVRKSQVTGDASGPRSIIGDLDLSSPHNAIGIDETGNPNDDSLLDQAVTLVEYSGERHGIYEFKGGFRDQGFDIEYDDANKQVRLVPASFAWWASQRDDIAASASFDGDSNGNQVADGLEYALDIRPDRPLRESLNPTIRISATGEVYANFSFPPLRPELSYEPQWKTDMHSVWRTDGIQWFPFAFEAQSIRFPSAGEQGFYRLKVQQP